MWHSVIEVGEPTPTELAILAELASVLDEIDVLRAALRRSSAVVVGSTGQPRCHPLLGELRRHRELADRLARSLAVPDGGQYESAFA
ncbi:MAG: hypothetical protein WAN71_18490 [Mycobacterium sp.]|uniref:hypothetical protein n=1 Tax=Mycobacterium sp. TaxID=1785 RepID=UPI003BAF2544